MTKYVRIKATRDYSNRLTLGKIYGGTLLVEQRQIVITDDNGDKDTRVGLRCCVDKSWFEILPQELNKQIKTI